MQYKWKVFWLMALPLLVIACGEAPEYPLEPVITYEGVNKTRVFQFTNGPLDTLIINFSFTDGDGDLSLISSDSADIFVTDSRLPAIPTNYRFPLIEEEGTQNGISGRARLSIVNTGNICCIFNSRICAEDPSYPIDTFSFAIQIRDRAGNLSNIVRTERIEIVCVL